MKEKTDRNWKFILYICLIIIVLFPMIYTIFYTIHSEDDFSMVLSCNRESLLAESIRIANDYYKNWSGIWLYMVIEVLFNPLMCFPLESQGIGIEMVCLFMTFVASLLLLIYVASKRLLKVGNKETIAAFGLIFLFVFFNTNIYQEVFYWFVGSSYMMAVTAGIVTIIVTIEFFCNPKRDGRMGVFLLLSGILACNFFQAAILPGMVFIVLWCWLSKKEHKLLWKKGIPFCFMFLSGLMAVIAPGNYVRRSYDSSSYNVVKGFVDACKMEAIVLRDLFYQPFVILLIVYCIYIGIRFRVRDVKGKEVLSGAFLLNCFPIAFGYADVGLSSRIYFLLNFTTLVGAVVTAVLAGMYVSNLIRGDIFNDCQVKVFVTAFVFLFLYATVIYNEDIKKLPWFQTVIAAEDVKEIHDVWQDCLIEIRDSKESSVELAIEERFFKSPVLRLPGLSEDPQAWVNDLIAQYFDKESVIVRRNDEGV